MDLISIYYLNKSYDKELLIVETKTHIDPDLT